MTDTDKRPMREWTKEEIRAWFNDPSRRARKEKFFKDRSGVQVDIGKLLADDVIEQ